MGFALAQYSKLVKRLNRFVVEPSDLDTCLGAHASRHHGDVARPAPDDPLRPRLADDARLRDGVAPPRRRLAGGGAAPAECRAGARLRRARRQGAREGRRASAHRVAQEARRRRDHRHDRRRAEGRARLRHRHRHAGAHFRPADRAGGGRHQPAARFQILGPRQHRPAVRARRDRRRRAGARRRRRQRGGDGGGAARGAGRARRGACARLRDRRRDKTPARA